MTTVAGRQATAAVRAIMRAFDRGAVGALSARRWAVEIAAGRASAGHVAALAGTAATAAENRQGRQRSAVASEAVAILAGGGLLGDEFAALWPPATYAEAERRRVSAASRTRPAEDELYASIWPGAS
jgi:hypothetical protein